MGGIMSYIAGGSDAQGYSESSSDSAVIVFHSSDRWQLHFNETKKIPKLMVVDFSASWCGPCKMMEPVFNAMSARLTDVEFIKIDVDELKDVSKEFGVKAMPTFVLLKQGKEVDRVVGAKKDELEKKVLKHRANRNSPLDYKYTSQT